MAMQASTALLELKARTLTGKTWSFEATRSDTIKQVKQKIVDAAQGVLQHPIVLVKHTHAHSTLHL